MRPRSATWLVVAIARLSHVKSSRTEAMIGTGLIAAPTASGST
jgi:hypothetical protein